MKTRQLVNATLRWSARMAAAAVLLAGSAFAQRLPYPPSLPEAKAETYKTVGDVRLHLWIFSPEGLKPSDKRPAIVFFFGGGWRAGNPAQFGPQCKYLASRGMVAITADYRVSSREDVKAEQCVEDAKSAVRWVRANAVRLGIDPKRIAAGGGSAGGHIAAATGVVPGFEAAGEDTRIRSVPNAMILFNPVLVLAPAADLDGIPEQALEAFRDRMGGDPALISPFHHVRKGLPPTLVMHGEADTTVPFPTVRAFCDKMRKFGNRCEVAGYPGASHGFFNYGRKGGQYAETVERMDRFLVSLGWLKAEPASSVRR